MILQGNTSLQRKISQRFEPCKTTNGALFSIQHRISLIPLMGILILVQYSYYYSGGIVDMHEKIKN